jgi:hypothetical protein
MNSFRLSKIVGWLMLAASLTLTMGEAFALRPSERSENRDDCATMRKTGKQDAVDEFDRAYSVFGGHPGLRAKFPLGERFGSGQLISFDWNKAKPGNLVARIFVLEQCHLTLMQSIDLDERLSPVATRVRKAGMKKGTPGLVRVVLVDTQTGPKAKESVVGEYSVVLEPTP